MQAETAEAILSETKETYNRIAAEFDSTRSQLWPGLKNFLTYLRPDQRVLDVGCGNGRLVEIFKDFPIDYIGLDQSVRLIHLAQKNFPHFRFMVGNAAVLPFADNRFDAVFLVAVLHHLPGQLLRQQVLTDVCRILKPGGYLFVTNWWRYDWRYWRQYWLPLISATSQKMTGRSKLDFKDAYIGWGDGQARRFYHYYTVNEQGRAVRQAGYAVKENYLSRRIDKNFNRRNIITIAQKLVVYQ